MKTIHLSPDVEIPILGLGTWELTGDACTAAVASALETGYRHIDTADAYDNHEAVAGGIRTASVPRKELFITTKIGQNDHAYDAVIESTKRFLDELDTDYIDLLLIHWPIREIPIQETLQAMNELKAERLIRAIGVSNFTQHHIDDALETSVPIVNNEVEIHPLFNQKELREYCASKGIAITAYSPLGRGADLRDPVIVKLGKKYGASPAQVILNWILNRDMIAIPKSAHPDHIRDNFNALNWTMEEADLARMDDLPQGPRLVNPSFNEFEY